MLTDQNGRGNGAAASRGIMDLSVSVLGRLSQGDGKLEAFLDYIISLCHINQNKKVEQRSIEICHLLCGSLCLLFPTPNQVAMFSGSDSMDSSEQGPAQNKCATVARNPQGHTQLRLSGDNTLRWAWKEASGTWVPA